MSQLDKLNYLPILFWFLVFFFIMYFLLFSYILPLIFGSLKVRELFYRQLLDEIFVFFDTELLFEFFFKNNSYYSIMVFFFSFCCSFFFWRFFFSL